MKSIDTIHPARLTLQSFATVTTSSRLEALQAAVGVEQRRTAFEIVPLADHSASHPRFDLRADSANIGAAIDTVRSLLGSLMDAADRGMLCDFKVAEGADLLHRIPGKLTYASPLGILPIRLTSPSSQ